MGTKPTTAVVCTAHAKSLILVKARQLCRHHGFNPSEKDDIQQELWLRLLTRANHFDPARGSLRTFVEQVVCSGVCVILRQRRRQRRQPDFCVLSLQTTMVEIDGDSNPLDQVISTKYRHRHLGAVSTDYLQRRENVVALEHALRSMSPSLRILCQQLSNGSAHSAARTLGFSRRQVRNAMRVIRLHLERAGFEVFWKKADNSRANGVLRTIGEQQTSLA